MGFFANKKLRYKKLWIIVLSLFILFLISLVLTYISIFSSFGNSENKDSIKSYDIESMDYHLRGNATEYQVKLFKELESAINEGDELKIVESVGKNFVADAYTWTNKEDKWDVGGMTYVYSRYRTTTYFELRDTLYKFMAKNIREYPKEELFEVNNIEVLGCYKNDTPYEIEENQYDSYHFECKFDLSGNENIRWLITSKQYMTIIKNTDKNGRFEIAEAYGD